uniref:Laminin subunit gamma-2 n=1 Tax=Erpetoichthys calabaricus TaxID=27687 RepID=A0A8C4SH56_ERPCA
MWTPWAVCLGILVFVSPLVNGTYREHSVCKCNGKSNICTVDSQGFLCLNCMDNTEGRSCENCKMGYFHQKPTGRCTPCSCSNLGSLTAQCDSNGRCSCKPGVTGDKCDRCLTGATLTRDGCNRRCRSKANNQVRSESNNCLPCFCYGHSSDCTETDGYSVYPITSTFDHDADGWRASFRNGSQVQFQWSSKHRDLFVTSKDNSLVYLHAPAKFLGNQVMSYGQNLTFSFRVDRGGHIPSLNDVILEGAGLKVSLPLTDMSTPLPCGQTRIYTFRLDEVPSSRWSPQLTSLEFQKLLENLTAIKIRGTYGQNSFAYLDNVSLISARRGAGVPATWVEKCSCPVGYQGQFCQNCAPGYKRQTRGSGAFAPCVPCNCAGGTCDPDTGDCYSRDESPSVLTQCPAGFYNNPLHPSSCLKCPCGIGASCSVTPGTQTVVCDHCPVGVTGPQCEMCEDGYFGDPMGKNGPVRQCQRCQCNNNIDVNALGNCNRLTGECLKCLYNTAGFYCERCREGFYKSSMVLGSAQRCTSCGCNLFGSQSLQCNSNGQCQCKTGFGGLKCEQAVCPTCYDQVKYRMEHYLGKLKTMESLIANFDVRRNPVNEAEMEKAIRKAETTIAQLQQDAQIVSDSDQQLLTRLTGVKTTHLNQSGSLNDISQKVDLTKTLAREYQDLIVKIQAIISQNRKSLLQMKSDLGTVELPSMDAAPGTNGLTDLEHEATSLADKHRGEAEEIELTAKAGSTTMDEAYEMMRSVISGENKVTRMVHNLKNKYKKDLDIIKNMELEADNLNAEANNAIQQATDTLQFVTRPGITNLGNIENDLKKLNRDAQNLQNTVNGKLLKYDQLNRGLKLAEDGASDLMSKGLADRELADKLQARAYNAKAEADKALNEGHINLRNLEDVLGKLEGFNEMMITKKAEADDSLSKIPSISWMIQNANQNNQQAADVLRAAESNVNSAINAARNARNLIDMQSFAHSGNLDDLLTNAHNLNANMDGLKQDMQTLERNLYTEEQKAKEVNLTATLALGDAERAFNNAQMIKTPVTSTLTVINDLLNQLDQPGQIDERRLTKMEESVNQMRGSVNNQLRPKLETLKDAQSRQRARIASLNQDISNILKDIENLEEIKNTIPISCLNAAAIERP